MIGPQFTIVKWNSLQKIVWISDNDAGGMTVTNSAEIVCKSLNNAFPEYRIIYQDTEGEWSELRHNLGKFIEFAQLGVNRV